MHQLSKALENSGNVIVVYYKALLQDPLLNTIVEGLFVSLTEDKKHIHKRMLIKKDECDIPTFLKSKYHVLDTTQLF